MEALQWIQGYYHGYNLQRLHIPSHLSKEVKEREIESKKLQPLSTDNNLGHNLDTNA